VYERILIHIDRRNAFETFIPFLEATLRRNIAREAVLTTAVKPCEPTVFGYVIDPEEMARTDARHLAAAGELLRRIAQRFEALGIHLQTDVLVGDPTEVFRAYVASGSFDLVIIAPTGRRYLLTGKPLVFRRALRQLAKPVMILPAIPAPAA
jgi:nucleotide-binding universal stress UspA family protein